jgi:hypothetical protein
VPEARGAVDMAHNTGRVLHLKREHDRLFGDVSAGSRSTDDTTTKTKANLLLKDKAQSVVTTSLIELPSCARHTKLLPYGNPREVATDSGTRLRWDHDDEEVERGINRCRLKCKINMPPCYCPSHVKVTGMFGLITQKL